jgi:hypothetical protein
MTTPNQTTFRIGKGRSSYDPEWSPSNPWSVVINGTVICYKPSAYAAELDLRRRGCTGETRWSA